VPKFTGQERLVILNLVANLSIKRMTDSEIIEEVRKQTNQMITRQTLYNIRQRIKRDSYAWYEELRQGNYEYIHEYKERINEISDLQRMHHKIIQDNEHNPSIVQTSLAELHKLTITLSNLYDVAPVIVTLKREIDNPIPVSQKEIIV
jgi:hypothetical protein